MRPTPQLQRLLNLIPYLQSRQFVSVATVAEDFGITARQVLGDLEVLQFCGLPEGMYDDLFHVDLEGAREDGHISFRNADVLPRPRKLRVDEASSLLVALEMIVEVSGGSDAARSALEKLRGVLGDVEAAVTVTVSGGDPRHRLALQRAIDDHLVVELAYTGQSGAPRRAEVEPALLRVVDGRTYLEAWSRERSGWRSFRLDRVDGVTATGETFELREGVPGPDDPWFSGAEQLTLVVDPRADWVAEYYPVTSVERDREQVRVTFPVGSRSWATALLLRLGSQVREVSDAAVAADAARAARAALEHYGQPGASDSPVPGSAG